MENDRTDADVVVSMTTWKPRIESGSFIETLESILKQKFNGRIKIVLTVTRDEYALMTQQQKAFLDRNKIEILFADLDIKAHKKHFYVM